ncbi:MAG TPA: DUF99 family protein [Geobacterales bacterium]|nr:DUF99 family protein [Geobacterales bacterium]
MSKLLVAGIDDGGFKPDYKFRRKKPSIPLLAVYCKGFKIWDIRIRDIQIDGLDGTAKLISMLEEKKPFVIFSAGITVGGFNLIDFFYIFEKTKIPSIIVLDHKPNMDSIKKALFKHFEDAEERWAIVSKYPKFKKHQSFYYESIGMDSKHALELILSFRIFSKYPEPLRLAHLIAKAIYKLSLEEESFS